MAMIVTPEQHIAEAKRRLGIDDNTTAYCRLAVRTVAEALASPAWVPPVDEDVSIARRTLADTYAGQSPSILNGEWDEGAQMKAMVAAVRAGRAAERAGGE